MASLGLTPFNAALIFEILANLCSIPALLFKPDYALSFLVTGPAQITPATRTLAQSFGGLVAGLTLPLLLSLSTPQSGPAGDTQRGFRRATYVALAGPEIAFVALMGGAYLTGLEAGITSTALLGGAANLGALLLMRGLFLFWKPHLLEERGIEEAKKGL